MAWHVLNKQLPSLLPTECFSTQCSYIDRQMKVADPRDKECVLIKGCLSSEQGGWKHFMNPRKVIDAYYFNQDSVCVCVLNIN